MDLFSVENQIIKSKEIADIRTGFEIELPPRTVGLIWDKGSTAHKGLKIMGGVFDENYRGELIIIGQNVGKEDYRIEEGDKIGQLLIQKIEHPEVVEVDKIKDSVRGSKRLGSTGNK